MSGVPVLLVFHGVSIPDVRGACLASLSWRVDQTNRHAFPYGKPRRAANATPLDTHQ